MGKKKYTLDTPVIKPIKPFLQKVIKIFSPQKMILFGSRVKGEALASSDYDLLLISSKFIEHDLYHRMVKVYQLQDLPLAIDVLCLTPKEFEQRKKELGIIQEAVREGTEISS